MKVSIASATKDQLNYAIAVSQGVKVVSPEFASYEAVKDWELPFTLWEVSYHTTGGHYTVSPIKVTCINTPDWPSLRSINFTDKDGRKCVGSIEMYHLTKESAHYEIEVLKHGLFDKDYHDYVGDWNLCGQLVDKFPYVCAHAVTKAAITGNVKEEIVRSVLTLIMPDQFIEVPDDQQNL